MYPTLGGGGGNLVTIPEVEFEVSANMHKHGCPCEPASDLEKNTVTMVMELHYVHVHSLQNHHVL